MACSAWFCVDAATLPRTAEVAEEGAEVIRAQLARMTFAMEEDVAANPLQIGLFGADAVVLHADDVAHLIEQAAATRHKSSA